MIGDLIYTILSSAYTLDYEDFAAPRLKGVSLFEFITVVMLSQNTNDVNAWRAYSNLRAKLGSITPQKILETDINEIVECIRVAGMYNERARRIRELAEIFTKKNLEKEILRLIEQKQFDYARGLLRELPGVGSKTSDVVLLMYYGIPVFPVDTHISRITRRLGYVKGGKYEDIREFWMKNTSTSLYLPLHLLLITHGRLTCRARKPLCSICVIRDYCAFHKGK